MSVTCTSPAVGHLAATITAAADQLVAALSAMTERFSQAGDRMEEASIAAAVAAERVRRKARDCKAQTDRLSVAVAETQQMLEESVGLAADDVLDLAGALARDVGEPQAPLEDDAPEPPLTADVPSLTTGEMAAAYDRMAAAAKEWPEAPLPPAPSETAAAGKPLTPDEEAATPEDADAPEAADRILANHLRNADLSPAEAETEAWETGYGEATADTIAVEPSQHSAAALPLLAVPAASAASAGNGKSARKRPRK